MARFYWSVWLRSRSDALVAMLPPSWLRGFLKTFDARPELAEAAGYQIHPRRFDSPLPILEEMDLASLGRARSLPGIDLRLKAALELVEQLQPFARELDEVPFEKQDGAVFWFNNQSFTDYDATALHAMLRWLKPKRYVELGCGFSSIISSRALQRNVTGGAACEAVYCDPEPRLPMGAALACGRFVREPVQKAPMELFTKLSAGDVLFIDTSHVLKIQSDVECELLRILPSLAPGVWIHVHDIFTPYDYPEEWLRRRLRLTANEQYAVECLLTGGDRYQIELPLHCVIRDYPEAASRFFPRGRSPGQSLWLRKVK
jgi:hypothetical protein